MFRYYGKVAQLFTPYPHISHFNKISATIYIWKVKFCVTILILHQISEQRWHRDTISTKATFVMSSSWQSSFDRSQAFPQKIESKILNQLTSVGQLQQPLIFKRSQRHNAKFWTADLSAGHKEQSGTFEIVAFLISVWSLLTALGGPFRPKLCTSHLRPRNLSEPTN